MSDLEKLTEEIVSATIEAPVKILSGTIKGIGSSISKLFDWM